MIAYTKYHDIPFKLSEFPDGQPHCQLLMQETRQDYLTATIEAGILSPHSLLQVLLLKDSLTASGYFRVNLDIRYLLGARMDRRIGADQPNTLEIICRMIMSAGFSKIRILDPHSEVSLRLLNATAVYPREAVETVLQSVRAGVIISPDQGATRRVQELVGDRCLILQGRKHRDPNTGELSGFSIENPDFVKNNDCLIIDDICDGGGTFEGLAKVLKENGARYLYLFVTHGIFSKGRLPSFKAVYTTDSRYRDIGAGTVTLPVSMRGMTEG